MLLLTWQPISPGRPYLDKARGFLAAGDYQAAGVFARVAIERHIKAACERQVGEMAPASVRAMICQLAKMQAMDQETSDRLHRLLAAGHRAAHGEEFQPSAIAELVQAAGTILACRFDAPPDIADEYRRRRSLRHANKITLPAVPRPMTRRKAVQRVYAQLASRLQAAAVAVDTLSTVLTGTIDGRLYWPPRMPAPEGCVFPVDPPRRKRRKHRSPAKRQRYSLRRQLRHGQAALDALAVQLGERPAVPARLALPAPSPVLALAYDPVPAAVPDQAPADEHERPAWTAAALRRRQRRLMGCFLVGNTASRHAREIEPVERVRDGEQPTGNRYYRDVPVRMCPVCGHRAHIEWRSLPCPACRLRAQLAEHGPWPAAEEVFA